MSRPGSLFGFCFDHIKSWRVKGLGVGQNRSLLVKRNILGSLYLKRAWKQGKMSWSKSGKINKPNNDKYDTSYFICGLKTKVMKVNVRH